ncbi:MAG: hypothetical protein JW958_04305 [Candidatus Eisenbacteria bacterium]|nr:hypothetical protein [Candidatus Eisenbacteria bacterium]
MESHLSAMADLESFDPVVFRGDDEVPQAVCDFVLALALAYNDLRDLLELHLALNEPKPTELVPYTKQYGAFHGINHHLYRLIVGMLHELMKLVRNHRQSTEHPVFQAVVMRLPKKVRLDWATLSSVASGQENDGRLGRALAVVRNKVVFHYDPGAIGRGGKFHFASVERDRRRAFVSRGQNMAESRFYFADAASAGWLPTIMGGEKAQEFARDIVEFIEPVNKALWGLIIGFVYERREGFRTES